MDNLHSQLSVLAKAIHYKNLSGAAAHIGLSQPQLSRIISRLEEELNTVLLDRTVRRKSGWTPYAHKIAETYSRHSRKLTQSLSQICSDEHLAHLHVGTLEGLSGIASQFCQNLFQQTKVHLIELDVYDLSELEGHFERNELDLIFSIREPGKQKYKQMLSIGYQNVEKVETDDSLRVYSSFEFSSQFGRQKNIPKSRVLISNSLAIRRNWVEQIGGSGMFPSDVRHRTSDDPSETPVFLIGSDVLNPTLWQKIESFEIK